MAAVDSSAIINATFLESAQVDANFNEDQNLVVDIEDIESNATFNETDELGALFDDEKPFTAELGESYYVLTNDYNKLLNKPSIEGIELVGNKTFPELNLATITKQEIDDLLFGGN